MPEKNRKKGAGGWLLIYLLSSVPVALFYSAGLSGWFLEYPLWLFAALFLALTMPLWLILLRSPSAPKWNVSALWAGAILITLRMAYGVFFGGILPDWSQLRIEELPAELAIVPGIPVFALGWATIWTKYFKNSARVRNTFF